MSQESPPEEVRKELPTAADRNWTVVSSLLVADQLTNRALEEHLLRLHYDGSESFNELDHIEATVERHEEIIDQLEFTKELLTEQVKTIDQKHPAKPDGR